MGNINFYQIIIAILFVSTVAFIYFFLANKNKTKSDNSNSSIIENKTKIQSLNEDLNDESLIAVLTAAVMAMQSNPDIKLQVTSFRRIPQSSPVWNTTGRREYIENKL